ncbi:MAG: ATP-binding protein, partial [Gammaproteobacteria bacterium]|nr:ATP-binding protein [Gammaproteobacteria bacterium]
MARTDYNAADIEVLTGLEPVRKRPGMYTDITRPNYLAQEVVDNSVDEAIAGYATKIEVTLHGDGSMTVADNGRGMPVDVHPEERISGVEVILARLHAGAKFSKKNYRFSGGLHGVGVSVVNALSKKLEVWVKRGGKEYHMAFRNGEKKSNLRVVGTVGKQNTGTMIRFMPDPQYFDSVTFSVPRLKHLLRAKAVLCPRLRITFQDEVSGEKEDWYYEDGLKTYLADALGDVELLPEEPFTGSMEGDTEAVDWAVHWVPGEGDMITESY